MVTVHWSSFQASIIRHDGLQPQAIDLALYEPFKTAIFTPGPEGQNPHFSGAEIDRVTKEWTEVRDQVITSLLPVDDDITAHMKATSRLQPLAVLFFRGTARNTRPVNLFDLCQWRSSRYVYKPDGGLEDPAILSAIDDLWTSNPWLWDCDDFSFDLEAYAIAKEAVVFVGMDPKIATTTDMKKLNFRFRCLRCRGSQWSKMGLSALVSSYP
jgi:hypothetical protein